MKTKNGNGALITTRTSRLRLQGESVDEMVGFLSALNERHYALQRPASRYRPVVIPSYNGARKGSNLTPGLSSKALWRACPRARLDRGLRAGHVRPSVPREFGLMPCASILQAQQALDENGIAFLPLSAISPGLNNLLLLRSRLGLRNRCTGTARVKMLDPFRGEGLLLAAATHPDYIEMMREVYSDRWVAMPCCHVQRRGSVR